MSARGDARAHVGDKPVVYVDVLNAGNVPETPTDGRLLVAKPGAVASQVVQWETLVKEPDGMVGRVQYEFPLALDTAGTWRIWWEFTAGIVAAEPFRFSVSARTVPDPA